MPAVLLIVAMLATLAPLGPVAVQVAKAPDPLTVVGAIAKSNRPAADATSDVFPDFHGKTAHRIFAFDWDALKALPQQLRSKIPPACGARQDKSTSDAASTTIATRGAGTAVVTRGSP